MRALLIISFQASSTIPIVIEIDLKKIRKKTDRNAINGKTHLNIHLKALRFLLFSTHLVRLILLLVVRSKGRQSERETNDSCWKFHLLLGFPHALTSRWKKKHLKDCLHFSFSWKMFFTQRKKKYTQELPLKVLTNRPSIINDQPKVFLFSLLFLSLFGAIKN